MSRNKPKKPSKSESEKVYHNYGSLRSEIMVFDYEFEKELEEGDDKIVW